MRAKGLFLAATLVFISCSFSQAGAPKIEFSERTWDFGRAPQQSTVSHIFWIKNIGTDTLKGISARVPWHCTQAPLKKTELAIGDSTELEISFFTGMAQALETKHVTVSSSDTVSGFNRLDITADVKPKPDTLLDISYAPYSLEFKEKKKGKFEEMKVEFTSKGQKEYKLEVIDYPKEFFQGKLSKETLMPGKTVELKVKPVKTLPAGTVKKSITLQVNGKKEFRITIPVKTEGSWETHSTQVKRK